MCVMSISNYKGIERNKIEVTAFESGCRDASLLKRIDQFNNHMIIVYLFNRLTKNIIIKQTANRTCHFSVFSERGGITF